MRRVRIGRAPYSLTLVVREVTGCSWRQSRGPCCKDLYASPCPPCILSMPDKGMSVLRLARSGTSLGSTRAVLGFQSVFSVYCSLATPHNSSHTGRLYGASQGMVPTRRSSRTPCLIAALTFRPIPPIPRTGTTSWRPREMRTRSIKRSSRYAKRCRATRCGTWAPPVSFAISILSPQLCKAMTR